MTRLRKAEFVRLLYRLMDIAELEGFDLNIASGNCGSFAVALKRVFGEGKLVAFSHYYEEEEHYGFGHVMVQIENKLYDGLGIHTKEQAEREWQDDWYDFLTENDINIAEEVPSATMYYIPIKKFEKMLRKIGKELALL